VLCVTQVLKINTNLVLKFHQKLCINTFKVIKLQFNTELWGNVTRGNKIRRNMTKENEIRTDVNRENEIRGNVTRGNEIQRNVTQGNEILGKSYFGET
jgi:hypothetical protein